MYRKSFLISAALHGAILFAGGFTLIQEAEFGMEVGQSNLEVDLIAAPEESQPFESTPEVHEESPKPAEAATPPALVPPETNDFILREETEESSESIIQEIPQPQKEFETAEKPQHIVPHESSDLKGDESSSRPANNLTTIQSTDGAKIEAKPDYLKNPPPPYPEIARRLKQEGLVLLMVNVDAHGWPSSVHVKESSGYRFLDEAALKAVRKWKFSPAKINSLPIPSNVDVPIRFQLNG